MTYLASDLRLPAETNLLARAGNVGASAASAARTYLRRQWIYHRTLADLQRYTQRDLMDVGAHLGVEEFARRAAGFRS